MKRKKANGIQNIFFSATHWLKKKKAFLREDELNAWEKEKQKKMWEKRFSFTFRATIATWAWRRKIGKRIKKKSEILLPSYTNAELKPQYLLEMKRRWKYAFSFWHFSLSLFSCITPNHEKPQRNHNFYFEFFFSLHFVLFAFIFCISVSSRNNEWYIKLVYRY